MAGQYETVIIIVALRHHPLRSQAVGNASRLRPEQEI
jgi:hypothetical protein